MEHSDCGVHVIFTSEQVVNATKGVVTYIEANHKLPDAAVVNGVSVDMKRFSYLLATALLDINGKLANRIALKGNYNSNNVEDNVCGGIVNSTVYVKIATDIKKYMDNWLFIKYF